MPPLVPGLLALSPIWRIARQDTNPFLSNDEDILVVVAAALTAIYALGASIILL